MLGCLKCARSALHHSDFLSGSKLCLELGLLGGDLLRHLLPGGVQLGGQHIVGDGKDLGGQHSSIFRAVQCYRSHRDAAGHLDCGQQGIQPIQDAIQDGVMEVTTSAARAVADYLALELTRMFLFLVSFALVLLLWLLLSRVLDLACAGEFVRKLPQGLDTKLKEGGGSLSSGQVQRLSIARALLADAPVLLLDEATSALDVATERKVLRNVLQAQAHKTVIVTTHRPSVLNICNRAYQIANRRICTLTQEEIRQKIADF